MDATPVSRVSGKLDRLDELLTRSVGEGSIPGTNVMYPAGMPPLQAQSWDGWPVEWEMPLYGSLGDAEGLGFGYGRLDPAGYLNRVSTVMSAVDINSQQLASFPAYEVDSAGRRSMLPEWGYNPEPEVYADWQEFMTVASDSLQLDGELFLYATGRYASGAVARFVVVSARTMEVDRVDGRLVYAQNRGDGFREPLESRDVLHVKYQSSPGGLRGIGPLAWLGRNLCTAASLEQYAADIAAHGVWATLIAPGNLNDTQRDDLRANWMTARANAQGAPAVLSGGVQLETLSLSPTDMALMDLLVYSERKISAAMGVPGELLGIDSSGSMTYRNAESLYDFHWRSKLRTLAARIVGPLGGWALPRGKTIELDRDEYVRPGLPERAAAYSTLHSIEDADGTRALDVAEIRRAERWEPAETPEGNTT